MKAFRVDDIGGQDLILVKAHSILEIRKNSFYQRTM